MNTFAPTETRFQTVGPWDAPDTIYLRRGPLLNFAGGPIALPYGYYGHHETGLIEAPDVEHWFQACKATSREAFDFVMAATSPSEAKRRGRGITLRPDWEHVKFAVMVAAQRAKFALEPYRPVLLATGTCPLAEDSRNDHEWGCRDANGGYNGRNLHGISLMVVRAELHTRLLAALTQRGHSHGLEEVLAHASR